MRRSCGDRNRLEQYYKTMKLVNVMVGVVWVIFLWSSVVSGLRVPSNDEVRFFSEQPVGFVVLMMILPFFSGLASLLFDDVLILPRTVSRFTIRLRVPLLLGCCSLIMGVLGCLCNMQRSAASGAYLQNAFFVSAGIGLLLAHYISYKKGRYEASGL